LPSIVREISATDMPLSQPPPSYSMICVFYDTRIRMIRVFYDTRIRMIRVSYAYHTRIIRVSYVKIYASGTVSRAWVTNRGWSSSLISNIWRTVMNSGH
jgi:hypothetical protein